LVKLFVEALNAPEEFEQLRSHCDQALVSHLPTRNGVCQELLGDGLMLL
jgi:hypothetical protein